MGAGERTAAMNLLILGGTRFLGRHVAQAALARGDHLTLFNRGRTAQGLFAEEAEQLLGDRDGGLAVLSGRRWDAVIDTCGYLPRVVRQSVRALHDAVGRYLFVSSISVYADQGAAGQDEYAPRASLPVPDAEDIANHYGALKAACEDEVIAGFGERAIVVRPGLIVGPFDPSGRFTYWVQRVARGGTVLAPPSPDYPVQWIDARDLALWMLALLNVGSGAYNACGPAPSLSFAAFLDECRLALRSTARFVWPDAGFVAAEGVRPWTELPLWAGEHARGLSQTSNARALAAGLKLRPLAETAADTARWAADSVLPDGIGLDRETEAALLQRWLNDATR